MNENKLKHIELIQGVINRMASNSFLLKGWTITVLVAIFAFSRQDISHYLLMFITLLPVIVFWFLDGYFLYQERLYRGLYNDVIKKEPKDIDFSMGAYKYHNNQKNNKTSSIFSETLIAFYLPLLIIAFVLNAR